MTHDEKHVDEAALDEVARGYAAAEFREAPPPHVDSAILDRAAQVSRRLRRRFAFRPVYLAWAAVIALSLSAVLELAVRTPQVPRRGVESTRQTAESGAMPREADEAPVDAAADNGAEGEAARAFAFDGDREAAQLRIEEGRAAASSTETDDSAARTGAESAADATDGVETAARRAARPNRAVTAAPSAMGCAEWERATPESWLACIEALNGNAAEGVFAAELAAFRELYPDHILPPELAGR
jgi:hypothetical protein